MYRIIFSLILVLFSFQSFSNTPFVKGEPLQVMYFKVWGYENPEDVSTRISKFITYKSQILYQGTDERYPGYYLVQDSEGKAFFVKESLLESKKEYSTEKIKEEIKEGKRPRSQYETIDLKKYIPFKKSHFLIFIVLLAVLLYFLWKKYKLVDTWFVNKQGKRIKVYDRPQFIINVAFSGIVVGGFLTVIAPSESEWFLNEGFRLWAKFPHYSHWFLWMALLFFFVNVLWAMVKAFKRFDTSLALAYVAMLLVLLPLYFFVGLASGGLVVIFFILYLFTRGSSSSSGGGSSSSSGGTNTVYDPSRSQRWNEQGRFEG